MATTAFTAFLPEILPQLPACSDLIAVNAVRNACIDFCTGSLFWNETLDPVTVTDTDFPYDLEAPSGARVVSVMSVAVDGKSISPVFLDALEKVTNWRTATASAPTAFCQPNPSQMFLYPRLDVPVSMVVRAAFAPSRTATNVDSLVYNEYLEEIAAGAMGKLMKMPGQPWSNPETGVYYSDMFEKAITDAASRVNKSFSRSDVAVAMRAFA
jgi:hypothetical protein